MPDALAPPPRPEASVPVAYAFELKEPQPVATGWGHFMLRDAEQKKGTVASHEVAVRGVPHRRTVTRLVVKRKPPVEAL